MTKQLPLIAIVSLGVLGLSGCGEPEVEPVEEDVTVVAPDQPPLEGDTPGVDTDMDMEDDMAMDRDMRDMNAMGTNEGAVITVTGFQPGGGEVYVALQDRTIFGTGDATFGGSTQPGMDGAVEVMIPDVTPGEYAVAAFQDINGNGTLDLGANGVPTEPWALSNEAGTDGPPEFDDAMMEFDGMGDEAELELSTL